MRRYVITGGYMTREYAERKLQEAYEAELASVPPRQESDFAKRLRELYYRLNPGEHYYTPKTPSCAAADALKYLPFTSFSHTLLRRRYERLQRRQVLSYVSELSKPHLDRLVKGMT